MYNIMRLQPTNNLFHLIIMSSNLEALPLRSVFVPSGTTGTPQTRSSFVSSPILVSFRVFLPAQTRDTCAFCAPRCSRAPALSSLPLLSALSGVSVHCFCHDLRGFVSLPGVKHCITKLLKQQHCRFYADSNYNRKVCKCPIHPDSPIRSAQVNFFNQFSVHALDQFSETLHTLKGKLLCFMSPQDKKILEQ